jgi:hypothetical protein
MPGKGAHGSSAVLTKISPVNGGAVFTPLFVIRSSLGDRMVLAGRDLL